MAGAPSGNKNAVKAKPWAMAIERALAKRTKSLSAQRNALDDLAEKLLEQCEQGDMSALKELGDRLDGKPQQSIETKIDGNLNITRVEVAIVDPAAESPAKT